MLKFSESFINSFAELIGNEGKFKKDPKDRMDWDSGVCGKGKLVGTKYGISAGTYPKLDIFNLTLDEAREIYHRDFWMPNESESLDPHVAYQLFDADINHGPGNGARMMQRALKVADDGRVGPITMNALRAMNPLKFNVLFLAERLEFFTKCSTWDHNSEGWALRIVNNLRLAVK